MLQVCQLTCARNENILFRVLNFKLNSGDLLQVLAPNGAGKTSLLRLLCGLLPVPEGQILWRAKDIKQDAINYKQQIAYVGHKTNLQPALSPIDNLKFLMALSAQSIPDDQIIGQALKQLGLSAVKHTPCEELSAGQSQRVSLARLFLKQASLWLLDEPFSALDQKGREIVSSMMENQVKAGGIVIVATHHEVQLSNVTTQTLELETNA